MKDFRDFGIETRGHSTGQIKTVCPQCSPGRKKSKYPCLSVNLDEGVWYCHHCDWRGSLKEGQVKTTYTPKPQYLRPRHPMPLEEKDVLAAWAASRDIPMAVVERRGLVCTRVYFPHVEAEMEAIAFPYYRDGQLVNLKYRALKEKYFRMAPGAERILYGIDDIQGDTLLWCEGELDALSLEAAGFSSVVSVPDGAPSPGTKDYAHKFDFLESAMPAIQRVERHILAVDTDAPGITLANELARRLGPEKCYRVVWSSECKDANDVLMSYGPAVLCECIENADPWPVEGLIRMSQLETSYLELYDVGVSHGISTGWAAIDPYYTVKPGEWTLVTGIPSHGKSSWLSALAVQMAQAYGWRFAICPPEQQPFEQYAASLAQLLTGAPFFRGPTNRMSRQSAQESLHWIDEHVSLIMPHDHSPTLDEILDLARVEVLRRGVKGVMIDPYNELDHSRDARQSETEYISQFISKIRLFSRRHQVHVWVVAHPTKLHKKDDGTYPVPTAYDVTGSAHWYNKADNVLTIYRDVRSDNDRVELYVQKVRFRTTGKPGLVPMNYHRATGRFST